MTEAEARGRPRKFDYSELDEIGQRFNAKTRRGQQNHEYAGMAFHVIKMATEEHPSSLEKFKPLLEKPRPTVLAELGRALDGDMDPDSFWMLVHIAANSPHEPAKRLASVIRAWRLPDPGPEERTLRLRETLLRTVEAFLTRHPQTDLDDVLSATSQVENIYIIRQRKEGSILPPE